MGGVKINGRFHLSIEEEFLNPSLSLQNKILAYVFDTRKVFDPRYLLLFDFVKIQKH